MNTIPKIIEEHLESGRSKTAFTFLTDGENNENSVSLNEIRNDALKIAGQLQRQSTVLICLPQSISFIKAFIGCLYARAIAVPVAVPTKNRGLESFNNIIKDACVSVGITNRNTLSKLEKWFGEYALPVSFKWLLIEESAQDDSTVTCLPKLPQSNEIAFLQYTSGSTGNPKAVMITHENIIANSKFIQKAFQNNSESVSVCWLPSFHDMGLIDGIIQPVFSGFHSILMSPVHFLQKPVRWFKAITKYQATYSGAPNFAYDFCCDRIANEELANINLNGLRCLYNGSEPVRAKTINRFVDKFSSVGFSIEKMFPCYGLAESTLAVSMSTLGGKPTTIKVNEKSLQQNRLLIGDDKFFFELVGCGRADDESSLKIINPDTLKECTEKEIGEIYIAGKSVTLGYRNDSELTDKSFVKMNGEIFLRTGDLGFLLDGELFVTGRIKDLIVIRGKNHYPQDIEQTVSQSHPALQAHGCAAFSVDIDQEEQLILFQEVKRTFLNKADYDSVFSSILNEINSKHGVSPHDVVVLAPGMLPKTTSGKVQRSACRKLWLSGNLKPVANFRERAYC